MRYCGFKFCVVFGFMVSCCSTNHQTFVKQADSIYKDMICVLEKVEHPSDMYLIAKTRVHYLKIAKLILKAYQQEMKHPELFNLEIIEAPHSEELKKHLIRIYTLEGGAAACEAAARDALALLRKLPSHEKAAF